MERKMINPLNELFSRWMKDGNFITDGLLDRDHETRYLKSKRILFLLKEPGGFYDETSLCKILLGKGKSSGNHRKLARLAYGIQNATKDFVPLMDSFDDTAYLSSAFLNL